MHSLEKLSGTQSCSRPETSAGIPSSEPRPASSAEPRCIWRRLIWLSLGLRSRLRDETGTGAGEAARCEPGAGEAERWVEPFEVGGAVLPVDVGGVWLLEAGAGLAFELLVGGRPLAELGADEAAGVGRDTLRSAPSGLAAAGAAAGFAGVATGFAGTAAGFAGTAGLACSGFWGGACLAAGAAGAAGLAAAASCFRWASVRLTFVPQKMQKASDSEISRPHLMQPRPLLLPAAGAAADSAATTLSVAGAMERESDVQILQARETVSDARFPFPELGRGERECGSEPHAPPHVRAPDPRARRKGRSQLARGQQYSTAYTHFQRPSPVVPSACACVRWEPN